MVSLHTKMFSEAAPRRHKERYCEYTNMAEKWICFPQRFLRTPFYTLIFRNREIRIVVNQHSHESKTAMFIIKFRYMHSWKRSYRFYLMLFEIFSVSLQ